MRKPPYRWKINREWRNVKDNREFYFNDGRYSTEQWVWSRFILEWFKWKFNIETNG